MIERRKAQARMLWRLLLLLTIVCVERSTAFVTPASSSAVASVTTPDRTTTTTTSLSMFNLFGSFGDFLNDGEISESTEEPAGTTELLKLKGTMKPGGLRLFVMLFLMGLQNTPDRQTWKAHQPSNDTLEFWYTDKSAVLEISFAEHSLSFCRVGSNPSTQYLMQESIVLSNILDELETCATEGSVSESDRLLIVSDTALLEARDALAFG